MTKPSLGERRKTNTRREIAETAITLFGRDGFANVSVDDIACEVGISLRTFYRYFSAKDEVLSPIVTEGTDDLISHIAERPSGERLAVAVVSAYREISVPTHRVQQLIQLVLEVPALRARWMDDLRSLELALVPIIQERTSSTEYDAHLTATVIVTAIRVSLEISAKETS